MGLHGLLRKRFTFVHEDYVRTSLETQLWASTTCSGDGFTFYMYILWSSNQSFWLLTQRSRVRFPALPDFSE
jgi:hypothetical protein